MEEKEKERERAQQIRVANSQRAKRGKFALLHNPDTASRRATRNRSIRDPSRDRLLSKLQQMGRAVQSRVCMKERASSLRRTRRLIIIFIIIIVPAHVICFSYAPVSIRINQINHLRCIVARGIDLRPARDDSTSRAHEYRVPLVERVLQNACLFLFRKYIDTIK